MGRILGMGSRRECVAASMAREYRVPAFDHGAGEARDAAQMERDAGRVGVPAFDIRDVHHAKRGDLQRSLLRAIARRYVVRGVSRHGDRGYRCLLYTSDAADE